MVILSQHSAFRAYVAQELYTSSRPAALASVSFGFVLVRVRVLQAGSNGLERPCCRCIRNERSTELELIQTQMAQKPMLRAEVGMRVRCANKASAE